MWLAATGKALLWWFVVYFAIKLARLAFAPSAGYREAPPGLRERLRAGEPALVLVAFALTVPLAFVTDWYAHRKFTLVLERSLDCHGRLSALSALQPNGDKLGGYARYGSIREHRAGAFDAAAHLDRNQSEIGRELDLGVARSTAAYASLRGHAARLAAETHDVDQRCALIDDDHSSF